MEDLATILCERCSKNKDCSQMIDCSRAYFIGVQQIERNIIRMVFDEMLKNSDFSDIEDTLRYLLNRKIAGEWDDSDTVKLSAIKSSEWVTSPQRFLIKTIEKWEEY